MISLKKSYYFFIMIAACVSSAGTLPYGFRFAQILEPYHYKLYLLVGVIFALTSGIANIALGSHALLSIKTKFNNAKLFLLFLASIISAIPTGCMCYFAYVGILPYLANILATVSVTFINIAIAYNAVQNLVRELKKFTDLTKNKEIIFRIIGLIIGLGVSLTAYMACIHGLTGLFNLSQDLKTVSFQLACIIGFVTWLPFAALYANSMQVTGGKIFHWLNHSKKMPLKLNLSNLLIIFIALFSGSSFAQIAIDFFDPEKSIPTLFKLPLTQLLIYNLLVPLAFIASAIVNYFALKGIFELNSHPSNTRKCYNLLK